jgi:hypothetical protein
MVKFNVLDVSQSIDTPFRVRRAFDAGEGAAYVLGGLNALTAILIYFRARPFHTLAGTDPHKVWIVHVVAALLAAALGLVVRFEKSAWACWVVFVWALIECVPPLTGFLYAHGAIFPMGPASLLLAWQGLRAVFGRARLRAQEPASQF